MISTRGRYALRIMIDLAQHWSGAYIPMKEAAQRQGISLKYLEQIMPLLVKKRLVESSHGKGGGYRLARNPEEYSVGEILRVAEGSLAPVTCLEPGAPPCPRADSCPTLSMWKNYYEITNRYFDSISLADLMGESNSPGEQFPKVGNPPQKVFSKSCK